MNILSKRQIRQIQSDYRQRFGITPEVVDVDGRGLAPSALSRDDFHGLPMAIRANADALHQALRWGEAYVFYVTPGVMSWIVPLVDGQSCLGGIRGGNVMIDEDAEQRAEAVNYLVENGCSRTAAARIIHRLPVWPRFRPREAARCLYDTTYQVTGFKPTLLVHNRENALQQRQIAESIHERKRHATRMYPMREEQSLLSLMRVGDRNGARRVLNETLAAIFLVSPNPVLLRARTVEMMGVLVRAAIEDNPMQESLMERHQEWVTHITRSEQFEDLCEVLRYALDDFMTAIYTHGYNRGNRRVRCAMDFIAANFTKRVTLDAVARAAGLSRCHVARLVKTCTGKTISQHVLTLRIKRARDLLRHTRRPYAQIAYDLGFTDQSYFIKQFRAMTGTTPRRYRITAAESTAAAPQP